MLKYLQLEQRIIIKFLRKEGLATDQIVSKLQEHYHEHAYEDRTVRFWMTELERGREDLRDAPRTGRPPLEDIDDPILDLVNKYPFESVRSIAQTLGLAASTVLRHLTGNLGYHSFHLRCVPHLMTPEIRENRKQTASEMLPILEEAARNNWKHLITGDESWFFLSQLPSRMWSLTKETVETNVRRNFQCEKIMFTIMWNPHGFYVIDSLPPHTRMNSTYYTTNILQPLYDSFFPQGHTTRSKKLILHVDNCSIHKSREAEKFMANHRMIRMPHPPYSPEMAPSDFYLFGAVKNRLNNIELPDREEFFEKLHEILMSISHDELNRAFNKWIDVVRQVSEGTGDYIEE
jgi:transposase